VGRLLQSGAFTAKWSVYCKVRRLLQSGAFTEKWGVYCKVGRLLQSGAFTAKWSAYCKDQMRCLLVDSNRAESSVCLTRFLFAFHRRCPWF
jgi:hypothetical protein